MCFVLAVYKFGKKNHKAIDNQFAKVCNIYLHEHERIYILPYLILIV